MSRKRLIAIAAVLGVGLAPAPARSQVDHRTPDATAPGSAPGPARAGYAPVNGLRMYYEVHGTGRPLVLLHGGGSTIRTSFGEVLPALAESRQVVAVETQGHGHTADIDRPLSFAQDADDVAALLRHLGIDNADFFGYSNGGNVALQMAVRHPDLVGKLVVASTVLTNDGLYPEIRQSFFNPVAPENMPPELRADYERVAPNPEALPTLVNKLMNRMRGFEDMRPEVVRSIDAPTLILIADSDVVRPEHAVQMYRLLPRAQLAVLPGTDHMALVKRADMLLSMIPAFLDAPGPAAR